MSAALPQAAVAAPASGAGGERWVSLEETEKSYIRSVLEHVNGRLTGPGSASEILGLKPSTLHFRLDKLGLKVHWTVPDYLQRSARHLASKTDLAHAEAVGKAAVAYALAGRNGVMPIIQRVSDQPYRWKIVPAPLADIANHEKKMPAGFIRADNVSSQSTCNRISFSAVFLSHNWMAAWITGRSGPACSSISDRSACCSIRDSVNKSSIIAFNLCV